MSLALMLALLIWLAALTMTIVGTFLAFRGFKTSPPHLDAPFGLYPVSILKPLKGADPGLHENLQSFFELNYPDFELLFSVADPRDPARPVVEKLMREHPGVRARLIIGQESVGLNPKINNMVKSYEQAKHDLLLISDSNVRVEKNYLKRQVAHLDNGVGMVTAVVTGREASSVGGKLESLYLNTFYARWMALTAAFDQHCVVGKSMLFSKKTAERFGGLKTLGRYLAEDYMAGVAVRKLGLKIVLATDPVVQHVGQYGIGEFWRRHVRWGRIRKAQAPLAFFFEPLFNCPLSGLLGAWALNSALGLPPATFLVAHLGIWSACDYLISKSLQKPSTTLPLIWFLRELLSLPLWLHTAIGKTVQWRGQKLSLQPGGLLEAQSDV